MAFVSRSQIIGFIKEDVDGELKELTAGSDFVKMRSGGSLTGAVETIQSDELTAGSIGASKSYVTKEVPTGSFPKYLKHSGVEGQAPQGSILIESCMGSLTENATEYSTNGSSSAGDVSNRAYLDMGSDQEDNFVNGQAVLIKDATNGYSIRNIYNVDSGNDRLDLSFNLSNAPATATALGKACLFAPSSSHPSFSTHHWQALVNSAYKQAVAGCKTSSLAIEFPANGFAEINAEFSGTKFYYNPIIISSTNKYIDITDTVGTIAVVIDEGVYSPIELATKIAVKATAASSDTITCAYSNSTGKFTLTGGATFSLLWNTGTNAANSIGATLGFTVSADDTGSTSYTSDIAISFDTALTPSYEESDNLIVKSNELFIGSFNDNVCVKASTASFSISTPKTDVNSICSNSGVVESVILSREVTFSATVLLEKFQSRYIDSLKNNTETSICFNAGTKSAGNWEAGKSVNIYLPQCSITASPIADQDGYQVFNLEATAYVGESLEDVYINFL